MNKLILSLILLVTAKAEAQTSALSIADSLYAVGDHSGSIRVLEKISPQTVSVDNKLARAFHAKGHLQQAKTHYKKVLKDDPERIITAVTYAKILMNSGELSMADSILSMLAKRHPESAAFRYQMGLLKEKQKDSSAISHYYKAIALDSTHLKALYKVSSRALRQRNFHTSQKYSEQSLKLDPENSRQLSILAQSYYYRKRYDLAIPQFQKLLESAQGSEFVHIKLGMSYYRLQDLENAISHFQLALKFEDRNAQTHLNLGQLFARTGDYEKSETHLLMAILLKKKLLDTEYLSLAITYKHTRDYEKAFEYLQRSLEENPKNERALYERAIVADNYFEDIQTRMNYYRAYLKEYNTQGNDNMVILAQNRIKDLRSELHYNQ